MRSAGVLDDAPVTSVPPVVPLTAPGGRSGAKPTGTRLASRRVRRNRFVAAATVVALGILLAFTLDGGAPAASHVAVPRPHLRDGPTPGSTPTGTATAVRSRSPSAATSTSPRAACSADRLAAGPHDRARAGGATQLLAHSTSSMVNFESALTFGTAARSPSPSSTSSGRRRARSPRSAARASRSSPRPTTTARTAVRPGLLQALTIRARTHYPSSGIGAQRAAGLHLVPDACINGEHIGIIAATQVIDADLIDAWTATPTQPGLASAYDVKARRTRSRPLAHRRHGGRLPALGHPARRVSRPDPRAPRRGARPCGRRHRDRQPRPRPARRRLPRHGASSTTASATSPSTTTRRRRT